MALMMSGLRIPTPRLRGDDGPAFMLILFCKTL